MRRLSNRRWARALVTLVVVLLVGGAVAWRHQSALIGRAAEWYLTRVATFENTSGTVERRSQILANLNRQLWMPSPSPTLVPELFDVVTVVANRVATGDISLAWVAYLYTTYQRDMVEQRPTGTPRWTLDQVRAEIDRLVQFYAIQKRPEQRGIVVGDILGTGDDVISLDEIEAAEKSGQPIDLRTRGTP